MNGWYAVDFDGTLAEYNGWQGAGHVGAPIERTVRRVKKWLKDGKEVRVFTARVYVPDYREGTTKDANWWSDWATRSREAEEAREAIENFCREQFGQTLKVTCQKDYSMVLLLDDRALQCYPNTGELVQERLSKAEKKLAGLGLEYKGGQYVRSAKDEIQKALDAAIESVRSAQSETGLDEIGQ